MFFLLCGLLWRRGTALPREAALESILPSKVF